MFYVYLLQNELDGKWYIGYTSDLRRRFRQHNAHENRSTKRGHWKLMYYEAYPTEQSARDREQKLKHHGKGIAELKRRVLGQAK